MSGYMVKVIILYCGLRLITLLRHYASSILFVKSRIGKTIKPLDVCGQQHQNTIINTINQQRYIFNNNYQSIYFLAICVWPTLSLSLSYITISCYIRKHAKFTVTFKNCLVSHYEYQKLWPATRAYFQLLLLICCDFLMVKVKGDLLQCNLILFKVYIKHI